jgi:hypothetical protein
MIMNFYIKLVFFNYWILLEKFSFTANLVWDHHFANVVVAMVTLFAISNYHWAVSWMICFILFVRLSIPYWLCRQLVPCVYYRLRAHGGCDLSAGDVYSSLAPDATFAQGFVLPYTSYIERGGVWSRWTHW